MGWYILLAIVFGFLFSGAFMVGFLLGESEARLSVGPAGHATAANPRAWMADLDRETLDAMRRRTEMGQGSSPGPTSAAG